ncbi:MAG: hypothetical protein EZS28_051601, partial [Streblomastix strix]
GLMNVVFEYPLYFLNENASAYKIPRSDPSVNLNRYQLKEKLVDLKKGRILSSSSPYINEQYQRQSIIDGKTYANFDFDYLKHRTKARQGSRENVGGLDPIAIMQYKPWRI